MVVSPGEHVAVQGVSPLFRMQPSSPNAAFPFGAMFEDSPLTGIGMHQIGSTSIHVRPGLYVYVCVCIFSSARSFCMAVMCLCVVCM